MALLYVVYNNFNVLSTAQISTVDINNYVFNVDVVKTSAEIERGLSGREAIGNDQAMLFIFPNKQKRVFWMKEMNFNIDLLWIDDDKIVAYEKNILAPDKNIALNELVKYNSPQAVDKVLEIKAGLIDSLDIKIGDTININI